MNNWFSVTLNVNKHRALCFNTLYIGKELCFGQSLATVSKVTPTQFPTQKSLVITESLALLLSAVIKTADGRSFYPIVLGANNHCKIGNCCETFVRFCAPIFKVLISYVTIYFRCIPTTSWLSDLQVTEFLQTLENDLSQGIGGRLDSIIGQCMYFGLSFSRVGADFRPLLGPVFERAVMNTVYRGDTLR